MLANSLHEVHSNVRQIMIGQMVWVECILPKQTEAKWLSGTILEKLCAVSYTVLVHT